MASSSEAHFDVAVVGAGPAGIAAALAAAESGVRVALLDDNPRPGGQIWRAGPGSLQKPEPLRWFERLENSTVKVFRGARVFCLEAGALSAESNGAILQLTFHNLILATGARELFLPFPGWTLPNVFGAGGLQALVKSGLPVAGKRVVIAGTGPLLMAVAYFLKKSGATVVALCEQTSWFRFARFGLQISALPGKLREAAHMAFDLAGVRFWTSCWPLSAEGRTQVESVQLSHQGRIRKVECDYLACGFHLVPNIELASLAGCRIQDGYVAVDEMQRTSVPNVFCAGEPTGIGGLDLSLAEGQIAGYASAHWEGSARRLFRRRAAHRKAVGFLSNNFDLRPELKALPQPKTFVCRCEDVPMKRLLEFDSWRAAKLQTRCGMGPCQGRVCGAAARFLFGWEVESVRPPVFPVKCSSLASLAENHETIEA